VFLTAIGLFETEEYERRIRALVSRLKIINDVVWTGFVDDIYAAFSEMDVFVLPSLYGEGMPIAVLEAMANGVPVVASNVEGVTDAIPEDKYGRLVSPGSVEALADQLEYLWRNPEIARSIATHAHNRQKAVLSEVAMCAGVAQVYREVLEQ
jgi:glycosyltransferase involved in cell wall biosynthesis